MRDRANMPDWPALMDTSMAADYCCISETAFLALAARNGVAAVDMGIKSVRYRRADLDRMIDSLPVREAGLPPPTEPPVDLAAAALQLVRARA